MILCFTSNIFSLLYWVLKISINTKITSVKQYTKVMEPKLSNIQRYKVKHYIKAREYKGKALYKGQGIQR